MKWNLQSVAVHKYWQDVSPTDWYSPHWQIRNALRSLEDFKSIFDIAQTEEKAFLNSNFQIRVSPYYASLAFKSESIKKILLPSIKELGGEAQSLLDPLAENKNSPVKRIIHRYSDRALFLVTDFCSVYCRYCTRKHFTGKEAAFPAQEEYDAALNYLAKNQGIREVILSGGDPLTLSDQKLIKIISDLRKIKHIEIIRIGTRMPVVCPMRITKELAVALKVFHPIYIMTHFNHPKEITKESAAALSILADNGFPIFNQMVLLNGINNHAAIVQALSRRLLYFRVKPYYMFQCDPSEGSDHLRTSIDESLKIQNELWGHLSGLAMPTYAVDIPDGGGKVQYAPTYETQSSEEKRSYKGWDGVRADYINPYKENSCLPDDYSDYVAEWEEIKGAKTLNFL